MGVVVSGSRAPFGRMPSSSRRGCKARKDVAPIGFAGYLFNEWHSDRVRPVVSSSPRENGKRGEESIHPGRSIHVDIEWLTKCRHDVARQGVDVGRGAGP